MKQHTGQYVSIQLAQAIKLLISLQELNGEY